MHKSLREHIEHLGLSAKEKLRRGNPIIKGVSNDSRKIGDSHIFVAIKGAETDGHNYIDQSISNGACAIVHSEPLEKYKKNIVYIKVENSYAAYARLSESFFNFPSQNLKIAGITGTNGKTTTAYILKNLLDSKNEQCGLISTVEYSFGNQTIDAPHTTPEAFELQKIFHEMSRSNCKFAVMEASSHGLDQFRMGQTKFKVGIFTNLTGDHLDYHKNMESYFEAKKRLFTDFMDKDGTAVINIDDSWGARLAADLQGSKTIKYGMQKSCNCAIKIISATSEGSILELKFKDESFLLKTQFIGAHNAYNMAAAFCAAVSMGIPPEKAAERIQKNIKVPGRLERIKIPDGAVFFIDYAHTDDALENVLKTLRPLCKGKLISVFGCGGNRDKSKRPRMGAAAAKYSDTIILTNDNPRNETPESIIEEIQKGIPKGTATNLIPDRKKAIFKAVSLAGKNDIALIAGKGHETYQIINGVKNHFSDLETLQEAIANL
jgi:UDP-N-acetylmuramoyl-L-alanyl-D-glutamate--2,6-diaminopimelate ligase